MKQILLMVILTALAVYGKESSITCNHITWKFDKPVDVGRFLNGEYWVAGPVNIIEISNDLHDKDWKPKPGQDGSMINPKGGYGKQGYHSGLSSYDESLNAGRPNGQPLSADNPLVLKPGQSLVSAVSWLYEDKNNKEPGAPRWYGPIATTRPALRSAAVLTCLEQPAPDGSFRPAYCGVEKKFFNFKDVRKDKLADLAPPASTPPVENVEKFLSKTWLDHMAGWSGAVFHPSMNMPNYGRDMGIQMGTTALMLQLDFSKLPGEPSKDKLLINLIQYGIDLDGIAATGGYWPADGGHAMGRKWPILFAGIMLDDERMLNIGHTDTRFQEDEQTFYVTQKEVDITNGPKWKPDTRSKVEPYNKEHIGLPEWGIRHAKEPNRDNHHWSATYRAINNKVFPGFVLAALIMDQKDVWNHDALFDYVDRAMEMENSKGEEGYHTTRFFRDMWFMYRKNY